MRCARGPLLLQILARMCASLCLSLVFLFFFPSSLPFFLLWRQTAACMLVNHLLHSKGKGRGEGRQAGVYVCPGHTHTHGAISSVRNAPCVYLWLQNPPDRGGLIFMGSVNRDFVFAGRRDGPGQTHSSHMEVAQKAWRREGSRLLYCTADGAQQWVPCAS